ncbi:hypothetical protein [Pararhodobacter aggregans]|uniref:hypothetical protein n=1 Tax=Pararhodobacter aggregans TaxID=404875 RepID=UPI003A92E6EA
MRPAFLLIVLVLGASALAWGVWPGQGEARQARDQNPVATRPLPYGLNVNLRGARFVARGTVPDEAVLSALAAEGVSGPRVLAGPPAPDWGTAALAGVAGLRQLTVGQFELRDRVLSFLGTARTPVEAEALRRAVLAALPVGYEARFTLAVQDDLTPPAYQIAYAVETGVTLSGKLPVGIGGGDVARALGIADLDDGSETALEGAPGLLSPALGALRDWLPRAETLEIRVDPGATSVTLGLGRGWDLEAARQTLALAVPGLTLSVEEVLARGSRRVRALGGGQDILSAGYWLPDPGIEPSAGACRAAGEAALPGAMSDPAGTNALAGALRPCLAAGYRVTVAGDPALARALGERLPGLAITGQPGQGAPALVWSQP